MLIRPRAAAGGDHARRSLSAAIFRGIRSRPMAIFRSGASSSTLLMAGAVLGDDCRGARQQKWSEPKPVSAIS